MPPAEDETQGLPFRAVVRRETDETGSAPSDRDDLSADPQAADSEAGDEAEEFFTGGLSGDDIEAAYLRAFEAVEAVLGETSSLAPVEAPQEDVPPDPLRDVAAESPLPSSSGPTSSPQSAAVPAAESAAASPAVTSRQVVEALLFVGGAALTTRKIAEILGEGFSAEQVEEIVDRLNEEYAAENRPYLVHWGEGGYRYQLRPEFEKVRNRVFGVGPREVKLSQEALEVLALVAYRQPLRNADLEATERKNAGSILRQLIRRELVELRRSEASPDEPTYHTTGRFLELFGLGSLDDLPFPADFSFK